MFCISKSFQIVALNSRNFGTFKRLLTNSHHLSFQTSILTNRFIATSPSFFHDAKFSTSSNLAQKSPGSKQQFKHNFQQKPDQGSKNTFWYILSGLVLMIGASYAAVPLFKIFCESQGIDVNTDFRDMDLEKLKSKLNTMKKVNNRTIQVKFVASTSADLAWNFEPCQDEIFVAPGETALAFFKAKNKSDRSIIGIATYTILPYEAGLYFNKIQCFCFEEQRLDPHDEVDMPVLFYIDDLYTQDPKLENIDQICLSYTFFESKGSEDLENLQKLHAINLSKQLEDNKKTS